MKIVIATYLSPLGTIVIESDGQAITGLRFCDEDERAIKKAQNNQGAVISESNEATVAAVPIIAETQQWLDDYFAGRKPCNIPRLNPAGTVFQRQVWQALLTIYYGETVSYGDIAHRVGCRSAQAVGQAVGANPIALIVPCHKVVAANGRLGGYAYGIEKKKRLLELEQR